MQNIVQDTLNDYRPVLLAFLVGTVGLTAIALTVWVGAWVINNFVSSALF